MGKINTAMCSFLSNKGRFADLFNGALFQGRNIIKAEDLKAASEQYPVMDGKTLHRFRDIKMYLNSGEALRILALENQNLEPAERLSGITQNDRLTPVYTLCLYHGEEPWNGPHTLRDMMNFGNDCDNLSHFFADYPMRLFCINEYSDFSCFHTELRELFTALAYRKNKNQLYVSMTGNAAFRKLNSETVRVMSILLNAPVLWKERERYMNINQEEEEEYNMCQALQELFEDAKNAGFGQGIIEGISQGISQGVDLMSLLSQKLFTDNRLEDLKKAVFDPEFREQLLKEYKLKN